MSGRVQAGRITLAHVCVWEGLGIRWGGPEGSAVLLMLEGYVQISTVSELFSAGARPNPRRPASGTRPVVALKPANCM